MITLGGKKMKKRLLALTLAAAVGISLFAGCGGSTDGGDGGSAGGGVITHNLVSEPKTIDPALNTAADGHQIISTVFEGLCRLDEHEQAIPGMAESWEISEDNLTYTFHLRDAKWSDGQPVKAGDFVYAWKRVVDPATAAEYAYQLYYLKNGEAINKGEKPVDELGVKAIDDKTLEVTLENITPYFLQLTEFPVYMPVREDIVSADPEGWALNVDTYIGNGPFKVSEWKHDDVLKTVKSETYYDADKVKLDGVDYVFIVEASTAVAAFEAGEIDFMSAVPSEKITVLKEANDPNFEIVPYLGTYFYVFNMEKEPVNNPKVRKALALAINRQALVDEVTKAGQIPATGFVPKGVPMSDGKTDFQEAAGDYGIATDDSKVAEAKQLLAEAGYPDGKGFPTIEVLYNTGEGHKAIAEALQAMWKQNLGINVELRNEEWKVFQTSRNEGNYTIARHGWIGDYVDPMTFLDMWIKTSGNNDAKFNNPKYDELISKAKSTLGKERDDAMLEAQAILMEEMPVIPLYYYTSANLKRTTIKNAPKSITGPVNYKEAYLEK